MMTRYPITAGERKCLIEKREMARMREWYYNKLLDEREAKGSILVEGGEASAKP